MQEHSEAVSNSKKYQALDIVEMVSVVGSIGGTIASAITQQVVFATVPLSLAVTLNLLNRRQQIDAINQRNQMAMGQIGQIVQDNAQAQARVDSLAQEIGEVKQISTNLGQATSSLQEYLQSLRKEQVKLTKLVSLLKEIETCDRAIQSQPNYAQAYYNKGLSHEALGERESAIFDYGDAIRIDPNYAEAHFNRGTLHAELGHKKEAVQDLREAARLYFLKGDIANYQKARDLSKNLHAIAAASDAKDSDEAVAVERLFS